MELGPGSYGLGFAAGVVSILSPCVLPLVPIVVATATTAHPRGAFALAAGVTLSFTVIGLFVATVGFAIGLDADWFRRIAAILLIGLGGVMLSAGLQQRFAGATASLASFGDHMFRRLPLSGLGGQLLVGLLLGLVWAPCVGPTLGAAATLASQGRNLGQVALVTALFGIGAGVPMVAIGLMSRRIFGSARGSLLKVGAVGKYFLATLLIALGLSILIGWDRVLEAWLVEITPAWLTELTTRF